MLGMGAGCSRPAKPATFIANPEEHWANSICQLCPSACGLKVRLANGHPVTVSGNPLHPVNRGGLCARGAASLQLYYDPDRLSGPIVRRQGLLGGWGPLAWSEGISALSEHIAKASARGRGRVAVIRGDNRDLTSQLLGRLVRASGSSWVVDSKSPGERAMERVLERMHGRGGPVVYDLAGTDFLLSLHSDILDSAAQTMSLQRAFAEMRSSGAYFVHAGPRMGITGAKADAWLPARPGSAGVLALGVAHMLIKEGYERADFLRDHCRGFDDWTDEAGVHHEGARSWILREFSPTRVAEHSGVEMDDIIRISRQFGASKRPLALGPVGAAVTVAPFDMMAVHVLNAVAGGIDVPGGVLIARGTPFAALDEPEKMEPGVIDSVPADAGVEEFADWVLGSNNPPIEVCVIHDADPVFSSENGERVAEALRKIPFVLSTSAVMNDTAENADVVLPGSLWIEKRCDATGMDGKAYPLVSLSVAAARPRADTRNIADVTIEVARGLVPKVKALFPWSGYDELIEARAKALYAAGVGDTFAESHMSVWTQLLARGGWRSPSYDSPRSLLASMERKGGWSDPAYYHGEWRRIAPHAGHRVDLEAGRFLASGVSASLPDTAGHEELMLNVYSEISLQTGENGSLPYLQDSASPLSQAGWTLSAELNAETAAELGIAHGSPIEISSAQGVIKAVAVLSACVRPDVVAVHTGGGRSAGGRYAAGIGANPFVLSPSFSHEVRSAASAEERAVMVSVQPERRA